MSSKLSSLYSLLLTWWTQNLVMQCCPKTKDFSCLKENSGFVKVIQFCEDSKKAFRNYLTFRIKIRCFIWLFNKIDNLIFSSPKIAIEHQGKIHGGLLELAYKDKFLYILPICEALCCESFTRDGSGGTKIWMI